MMKIGVTRYQGRVSPVFDSSTFILKLEIKDNKEIKREEFNIDFSEPNKRIERLKEKEIEVLICGAVSEYLLHLLERANILVYPFVAGEVNEVIKAFIHDKGFLTTNFSMPGCCGRRRRYGGHGYGRKAKWF